MVSTDHPEAKGGTTYKPVPFYMSSAGYGVWVDSFSPGRIDFNASDRFAVTLEYQTNDLRIVLIDGPRFTDILDEFTRLSGRPRVPPDWAFGVWKSRDVHRNAADVLEDVESLRKHDIPASVLVIDSPWETGYNDFELNRKQFQDPEALFARVRELGFYPCFWLTPFINSENRQDMTGIVSGATSTFAEAAAWLLRERRRRQSGHHRMVEGSRRADRFHQPRRDKVVAGAGRQDPPMGRTRHQMRRRRR